jgi:hypothetical protein
MLPPTEEIYEAIDDCLERCERSDEPFMSLAEFCETLRVARGWHDGAVWFVERRVLKMLGQLVAP